MKTFITVALLVFSMTANALDCGRLGDAVADYARASEHMDYAAQMGISDRIKRIVIFSNDPVLRELPDNLNTRMSSPSELSQAVQEYCRQVEEKKGK